MNTSIPALALNPAAEDLEIAGLALRFLVTGTETNRTLSAFEMSVPAGQRLMAPAHSHDHYEESMYGLAGVLTVTVNGQPFAIGPGQMLCIPRGAVHRFENAGSQAAKVLCLITPAEQGPQYFREMAEVIRIAAGGPPDKAKMMEIMHRHGLTPARVPA
jgi:quercetin dioxygenase-like cupin family protein